MPIRIPCSIFHQTGAEVPKRWLWNGFPAEQLPLNSPQNLEIPCIFPCCREFGGERFARDWTLRHAVWTAEKLGYVNLKIAGNSRYSSDFALKQDRRKRPAYPNAWHSGEPVDRANIRIESPSRYPRDLLTFQPCLEYCPRPCRNPNPLCPTGRRTDRNNQLRYL